MCERMKVLLRYHRLARMSENDLQKTQGAGMRMPKPRRSWKRIRLEATMMSKRRRGIHVPCEIPDSPVGQRGRSMSARTFLIDLGAVPAFAGKRRATPV